MTSDSTERLSVEIDDSGQTLSIPFWTSNRKRKQRNDMSLVEKVEVFRLQNEGFTQNDIGKKLGVSQSVVSRTLQQSHNIIADSMLDISHKRKRRRVVKFNDIDRALTDWFILACMYEVPVSQQTLAKKAKELSVLLGWTDFDTEGGWITRWRGRNSVLLNRQRRTRPCDVSGVQKHKKVLSKVVPSLSKYTPEDIYAASEEGIYYDALPGTLSAVVDGKLHTERNQQITVLLACNWTGTDQRPLLVTGEESVPTGVVNMPCDYEDVCYKSWMTSDVFVEWLLRFDADMKRQNRHILLIIDPSPVHPKEVEHDLTNIRLKFLDPDISTETNPCCTGISRRLKYIYRKEFWHRWNVNSWSNFSLLDALHLLNKAWWQVSPETIQWAFWKAGFEMDRTGSEPIEDSVVIEGLSQKETSMYVDVDAGLQCCGMVTDDQICANVMSLEEEDLYAGHAPDVQDDTSASPDGRPIALSANLTKPTLTSRCEVIESLATLRLYIETCGIKDFGKFYLVESQVLSKIKGR